MVSLISRIIGALTGNPATPEVQQRGEPTLYEGLSICAGPIKEGSQWRMSGVIIKHGDEVDMERTFTRADTFYTRADAESFSIRKGKQIIDEQGSKLFENGEEQGRA
jgi:hypothetical protein